MKTSRKILVRQLLGGQLRLGWWARVLDFGVRLLQSKAMVRHQTFSCIYLYSGWLGWVFDRGKNMIEVVE